MGRCHSRNWPDSMEKIKIVDKILPFYMNHVMDFSHNFYFTIEIKQKISQCNSLLEPEGKPEQLLE